MWRLAILATLSVATANNNNKGTEVFFRHRGFTVSTLGYVHIHMHVNASRAIHHMDEVIEMLNVVQLAAGNPAQRDVKKKWLTPVTRVLSEEVRRVRNKVRMIIRSAGGDPRGLARQKRFLAMLGALAGTFLGALNTAQIYQLQSRLQGVSNVQGTLIHQMRADQLTLRDHAEHLNALGAWSREHSRLAEEQARDEAHAHLASTMAKRAQDEGEEMVDILTALMNHRIHPTLFTEEGLDETWDTMMKSAASAGYMPIPQHQSDLFQCDASFRATEKGGLDVFIHVPVARRDDVMSVYEHVAVPMAVSDKTLAKLQPAEEVVAWARDGRSYRTMTKAALAACQAFGTMHLCEENTAELIQQGRENDNCVVNLYKRDYPGIRRTCPLSLEPVRDQALEVDGRRFVFISRRDHRGRTQCSNNTMRTFSADRISVLELDPGCQAETEGARATAALDIELELNHYGYSFPDQESPKRLLAEVDVGAWEASRAEAERITSVPTTIDGIRALQRAQEERRLLDVKHWVLGGVTLALVIMAAGTAGTCLIRKCCAHRKSGKTPAHTDRERLGPTAGSILCSQ
jgi:hypothetical protein